MMAKLLLLSQAATMAPGQVIYPARNLQTLSVVPRCAQGETDEIVVCARRQGDGRRLNLPPLAEPSGPKGVIRKGLGKDAEILAVGPKGQYSGSYGATLKIHF